MRIHNVAQRLSRSIHLYPTSMPNAKKVRGVDEPVDPALDKRKYRSRAWDVDAIPSPKMLLLQIVIVFDVVSRVRNHYIMATQIVRASSIRY